MYTTQIKQEYRTKGVSERAWEVTVGEEPYTILATVGDMSVAYNPKTTLLIDFYNYKLEDMEITDLPTIVVKAKNKAAKDRLGMNDGDYLVVGTTKSQRHIGLVLEEIGTRNTVNAYPSRLSLVSVEEAV